VLTYTVTSLNAGTSYGFIVIAYNDVGDSPDSSEATILAATTPDAPDTPTKVSASTSAISI